MKVIKRDGRIVDFELSRIMIAIEKALAHSKNGQDQAFAYDSALKVQKKLEKLNQEVVGIEKIQDLVEVVLMNSCRKDVATEFTRYRHTRTIDRRKRESLDAKTRGLLDMTNTEVTNENSNKDSNIIPTKRDLLAGIMAKDYAMTYMLPKKVVEGHENGDIHFHDQDYSPFFPMYNCMLINLKDMLENGFKLGNAEIETPKSITTACAVTAQIIAQVASHIYGGNTINEIDKILAPYVRKSYDKHYAKGMKWLNNSDLAKKYAEEMTEKETFDAFQSLEYEINTLATSNGLIGCLQ